MMLSVIGNAADRCWREIANHFHHIYLDEYVIMPNHVHGIVVIDHGRARNYEKCAACAARRDEACLVSTNGKHISPKPTSLATIVGSYKSAVTKITHSQYPASIFVWQPRFHDRIIRDEFEFGRIQKYVRENPAKWDEDDLHCET